jgi:methylmalonyl-CoA/ethylmalonyl-CoA epimerase
MSITGPYSIRRAQRLPWRVLYRIREGEPPPPMFEARAADHKKHFSLRLMFLRLTRLRLLPPRCALKIFLRAIEETPMAKLRHVALIVEDPEASARFFEQAFDMKRAGTARRGIYMSDGTVNVALLKKESDSEKVGIYHFGMWVDDLDEAEKKVVDAGGKYLAGRPTSPNSFYEAKYRNPDGVVFDLTHKGWAGAVKEVVAK